MKGGPLTRTMEKGHLPWFNFMLYGVNRPSVALVSLQQHVITSCQKIASQAVRLLRKIVFNTK